METPTSTVFSKSVHRLGLSRRIRKNVTTPKCNQTYDLPEQKSETTNNSAILKNGNNEQKDTPTTQPTNSENFNVLMTSNTCNETPISSRTSEKKIKLSLCKATNESFSRKRKQLLKSESLAQPKRLKLDESELILQQENPTSCDSSARLPIITNDTIADENSLTKAIAELKSKIENIKRHEQRSAELLALISKWREAGKKTIEDLKRQIEPRQDVNVILDHFNINPSLFN